MRNFRGIAECGPQFIDGQIDGVVEIAKTFLRPDEVMEFFSRDHLPGALQQGGEHLERLVLEL